MLIHLSRNGILPANNDESEQDPLLKSMADININVPTFQDNYIDNIRNRIKQEEALCFK